MALKDVLGLLGSAADFTTDRVEGLLNDPTGNLGLLMLAGQPFGDALQATNQNQRALAQRQLIQQELQRQQAQQRAQQALASLAPELLPPGLLGAQSGTVGAFGREQARMENEGLRREVLSRNRNVSGLLARAAPERFNAALIDRMFTQPQPTDLQRNLVAAGIDPNSELGRSIALRNVLPEPTRFQSFVQALGRQPTEQEVLDFYGSGGTTVNVGTGEMDEPFSPSELARVRQPDGSSFPIGTTPRQAQEAGGKVFTAAELTKKQQLETALGIVGDLKQLAVGPEGVFRGIPRNVLGRAVEAAANIFGDLAGTEASINRSLYTSMSQGTLAPLARSMGETGALAAEDAARALELLADLEGLPESEEVAKGKFKQLEQIFRRGLEDFDTGTSNVQTLPNGTTVEFLD